VNREGWRVIPGGTAFQNVRYAEGWPYEHPKADFDYANMTEADLEKLPREKNLRYGIAFPDKDLKHPAGLNWWVDDHPHTIGEYIVGLIYYEIIFVKSAVGCSYYPEDKLTADEASLLQKVVHDTAQGRMPPSRLFSAEDIAYYNEVLTANPNSVVESVEADEEYNNMTEGIWDKYGKLRVKK